MPGITIKQNLILEYSPKNLHLHINKTNSSFLTPPGFLFHLFLIYMLLSVQFSKWPIYHLVDFAWKCSYVVHFKLMSLLITLKCRCWTLSLSENAFSALSQYQMLQITPAAASPVYLQSANLAIAVRAPQSLCREETWQGRHTAYLTRSYLDLTGVWSKVIIMKGQYTAYACDGYIIHMLFLSSPPGKSR